MPGAGGGSWRPGAGERPPSESESESARAPGPPLMEDLTEGQTAEPEPLAEDLAPLPPAPLPPALSLWLPAGGGAETEAALRAEVASLGSSDDGTSAVRLAALLLRRAFSLAPHSEGRASAAGEAVALYEGALRSQQDLLAPVAAAAHFGLAEAMRVTGYQPDVSTLTEAEARRPTRTGPRARLAVRESRFQAAEAPGTPSTRPIPPSS